VAAALGLAPDDWVMCYQSRVGPVAWLKPYTDDEIRRAGAEKRAVVVVPIAFVSEHSETLVELDMDFRRLADEAGVPVYARVPVVGTHPAFIDALGAMVEAALGSSEPVRSGAGPRLCVAARRACAHA
jgi:ferrochelatase